MDMDRWEKVQQALSDAFTKAETSAREAAFDFEKMRSATMTEIASLRSLFDKKPDDSKGSGERAIFGIPDLAKRNEEAIFDALMAFEKKCAYCGANLFDTNIRQKTEIDHFFPIVKGGQDVPWNILPACRTCNRKKNSKLAIEFLKPDVFVRCQKYLLAVKAKYVEAGVKDYESFRSLRLLAERHLEFIQTNLKNEFVREFASLVCPDLALDSQVVTNVPVNVTDVNAYLIDMIRSRKGMFANGAVASPWHPFCERLAESAGMPIGMIAPKMLHALLKSAGWRDMGRLRSAELSSIHIYCAPEFRGLTKSAIRRIAEGYDYRKPTEPTDMAAPTDPVSPKTESEIPNHNDPAAAS